MSTTRMMMVSTQRPKKPARPPRITPMRVSRMTTTKPIMSEMRPPYIMRARISMPSPSVPNQCSAEGPA